MFKIDNKVLTKNGEIGLIVRLNQPGGFHHITLTCGSSTISFPKDLTLLIDRIKPEYKGVIMNCPVCANLMIKTKATAYGENYDYCRTCKKELKELTSKIPKDGICEIDPAIIPITYSRWSTVAQALANEYNIIGQKVMCASKFSNFTIGRTYLIEVVDYRHNNPVYPTGRVIGLRDDTGGFRYVDGNENSFFMV